MRGITSPTAQWRELPSIPIEQYYDARHEDRAIDLPHGRSDPGTPDLVRRETFGRCGPCPPQKIRFWTQDHERLPDLSAEARNGTFTPQERVAIDTYERLGCVVDILDSKARSALKKRNTAP